MMAGQRLVLIKPVCLRGVRGNDHFCWQVWDLFSVMVIACENIAKSYAANPFPFPPFPICFTSTSLSRATTIIEHKPHACQQK